MAHAGVLTVWVSPMYFESLSTRVTPQPGHYGGRADAPHCSYCINTGSMSRCWNMWLPSSSLVVPRARGSTSTFLLWWINKYLPMLWSILFISDTNIFMYFHSLYALNKKHFVVTIPIPSTIMTKSESQEAWFSSNEQITSKGICHNVSLNICSFPGRSG